MGTVGVSNKRGAGLDYGGLHQPSTLLLAEGQLQPCVGFCQSAPFAGRRVGCAVSEVLAGKRRLNLRQMQALAGRFSVPMEMLAG